MKARNFWMLLVLGVIFNLSVFAQVTQGNHKKNKKLYLTSGNIQIIDGSLFLCSQEALIPIAKVGKDAKGTYVIPKPDSVLEVVWEVTCPKCGLVYDMDNYSKKCPHGMNVYRPRS